MPVDLFNCQRAARRECVIVEILTQYICKNNTFVFFYGDFIGNGK